jgi:hypothetical protein
VVQALPALRGVAKIAAVSMVDHILGPNGTVTDEQTRAADDSVSVLRGT